MASRTVYAPETERASKPPVAVGVVLNEDEDVEQLGLRALQKVERSEWLGWKGGCANDGLRAGRWRL